jgi:hypothetical protein
MRKFLASTFVLALFAVAFAGPPIDYELFCETEVDPVPVQQLIGVLSLTEGGVHVALVEGASCAEGIVVVPGPDSAPVVLVEVEDWDAEPLVVMVTIGEVDDAVEADVVVVVPQVAVTGMLNAHSLRAAAMLLRDEAAARRDAARAGEHDASDDREASGPPEGVPPVAPPVGRP